MADSWGLIIILFFLLAFIIFIIKLFVEFPGLLQLSCVYSDNRNSRTVKTAEKVSEAEKHDGQVPDSESFLHQTESWVLQNRIVILEQDVKRRDKQIAKLQKDVVKLKHEKELHKKKASNSNSMNGDNVSDRCRPSEETENLEKVSDASIEQKGNNQSNMIQSAHCKEFRLLNKKITFDE